MRLAVGVDVGGTKVAAGLVDEAGRVVASTRRATPSHDPDATAGAIVAVVRELGGDPVAVGIGAAGFVDSASGTVAFAPNLAWRDEPLRARLASRLDVPVLVDNDANAAAWAECRFGAGTGMRDVVVVTVGTGIGVGVVVRGELVRGHSGFAGEAGHMVVVPDGLPCGCGNRGCWEQYASGNALGRLARERAAADPAGAAAVVARAGAVESVDGPCVTDAAAAGDPFATAVFAEVGRWLGLGLANLAAVLDPDAFVVGGGVVAAGSLLLDPARSAYAGQLVGRDHRPLAGIRPAALGNAAGLVGAADLARRELP